MFNAPFLELARDGRTSGPPGLRIEVPEMRGACDFVGINLYGRRRARFSLREWRSAFNAFAPPRADARARRPGRGGKVRRALAAGHHRLRGAASRDLGKPFLVTENGYADALDRVRPWVIVEAARRIHDLIARGFDVRGYHHWTLVDNFEWDAGWDLRFGLYELDLATQERRPRPSAALYGAIARENALTPEMLDRGASLRSAVGAVLDGALGPVVPGRVGPEDPLGGLQGLRRHGVVGPAGSRSRARAHATP